ncbi:unnamed protein product [Spirodela intermedia]|uniref:Uncharacterized protein n=1 Tax=Spirodela intermedia TaxID=51605 RepID=A0A7I8IXJ3_SPIIN|nr:unnamed protein product [Spirodela intermedia]CAA6662295.1 unnamed protein product [Spirodela intermedia]
MGGEVKVKSYCDACRGSPGLLFCRVHAAFLCAACDGHLHGGAARHERVWVCEICERAPAVVTCKADAAALCAACDSDVHSASTLSRRHQRFPVAPSPSPSLETATPSAEEIEAVETSEDGGGWAAPLVAGAVDREARVMRYREKRRNRRFEKIIRYASRKAYAESRRRVKGRFVKDGI